MTWQSRPKKAMETMIIKMVRTIKRQALAYFEGVCDPKDYTVGILMNMIDTIVNRGPYPERLREIIEERIAKQ